MDELILYNNENEPFIEGRALHQALGVKSSYRNWFSRACEYGFEEGRDFRPFLGESSGGHPAQNHQLTIDMAKELSMLQRTEGGRQIRKYLIEVEKAWNDPEAVIARALAISKKNILELQQKCSALALDCSIKDQLITEMQPKATYHDLVLKSKDPIPITKIAKDYGISGKKMNALLHELGVQFKQSGTWLLYAEYATNGYTQSFTWENNGHTGLHTYWTQAGRLFIYDFLKHKRGILPIMEQTQKDG
ncbi:phage antirepressor KilAC domain-containing protein [Faecalibaculum rodentium]|uniref:phage antirepressor KilAC domain-containing protein n=1 Tax=Faecalibaculum rodentium TaxID=1702221 RepID=UPI0023F513AE|nr:phage antirepressor KilAC domain-containing protein [Faecalibaculum rodentium]